MVKSHSDAFARALDWAIGLVSPRRAVIRQHFRRMEREPEYRETVFAAIRARGYRGAKDEQNSTPWMGGPRSADGEVLYELPALRNKSRELHRDDPIGSGALDTFAREIVGTELRPQSRASKRETCQAIESVWLERRSSLTPSDPVPFGQWQRMAANKLLEDGELIVKQSVARAGEPVWFEMIEGDRLQTPSDVDSSELNGGEIRSGVEKDRYGRTTAYWILKKAPNDFVPGPTGTGNLSIVSALGSLSRDMFDRVPASVARHVKLADRPGQTRGVPLLHAVLQDLRDLDLLMLASLKRVQVSACFALFIKSTQTAPELLDVTAENYGFQLRQDVVPGMIFKLYPGEEVTSVAPNFPVPELDSFVVMLARRIGAALGVSWQTILRDWSQSNYSSARTQLLADRPSLVILRHVLKEGAFDWMWTTVLEDAALRGDKRLSGISLQDFACVQWIADGWQWIDPLKEATATKMKLEMRITTLRDECGAVGKDWEENLIQSLVEEKRELELRAEMGLPPRAVPGAAAAPPVLLDPSGDEVVGAEDGEQPSNKNQATPLRLAG